MTLGERAVAVTVGSSVVVTVVLMMVVDGIGALVFKLRLAVTQFRLEFCWM